MADNSETAALSEAISDIFGEVYGSIECCFQVKSQIPAWTMGEDAQAGGYRNLQEPSSFENRR
jgi:Zn-dependent metalloprotease